MNDISMNIHIVRHSIRNRGGDKLVLDYCAYLVQKGHQVVYWTNEVNTSFPIDPLIQIRMIPFKGVLGTILFTAFSRVNSDVVLVDLVMMALFVSFRNRKSTVYLAQDYDVSYHRSGIIKGLVEFAYRSVLDRMQIRTISVSEGLSQKLQKYDPKKLSTIPNGVDLNRFHRDSRTPYTAKREKPFVILLFARGDHRKGLDIGIKSLVYLLEIPATPGWELWTIGTEHVEIPGVPVKDFGFLDSDEKLRDILSAVDIYLVPSRSEGLSLLLLQALACACAVVSTEASSIIQNNINGLISPIEDAGALARNLHQVMADDALRSKLNKNARILAEQFSFQHSCQQFEATLNEFTGSAKSGAP